MGNFLQENDEILASLCKLLLTKLSGPRCLILYCIILNSHVPVRSGAPFFAFHLVECASKYLLCSSRTAPVSLSNGCGGGSHSDTIGALCFSVSGALFASAGDDRLVKVWKTDLWRCIQTM